MSKLCKNCKYYDWPRVYYPCRCCSLAYTVKFKSKHKNGKITTGEFIDIIFSRYGYDEKDKGESNEML